MFQVVLARASRRPRAPRGKLISRFMKKEAPSFSSDNEIPRSKNASAEGFREKLEQVSEAVFTPNEKLESQLGKAAAAYNVENAIDLSGVEMWTIRQKIEALQGADPEKAKERLAELESFFKDAAQYLRQYGAEQSTAEASRSDDVFKKTVGFFERYGKTYRDNDQNDAQGATVLSEDRKREIERFLLGDSAYEKRIRRMREKYGDAVPEETMKDFRRHTVGTFFEALSRKGFKQENRELTWKDRKGPFYKLQETASEKLSFSANQPVREILNLLATKGVDQFLSRRDILENGKSLAEAFDLDTIKSELGDARKRGVPDEISQKVNSIVARLSRKARELFPYKSGSGNIANIVESKKANCAGSALLGSLLLKELDIPYAYIHGERHAFVGFDTPDGKMFFNHFQGGHQEEVTDDDFDRTRVEEIRRFIKDGAGKVLPVRMAIGTPVNWWSPDDGKQFFQETLYFYKNIEPGLFEVLYGIKSEGSENVSPASVLGAENIIDPYLLHNREGIKRAIELSPNDPKLFGKLSKRENAGNPGVSATDIRLFELAKQAVYSEKGKQQRKLITKIKEKLKKLF